MEQNMSCAAENPPRWCSSLSSTNQQDNYRNLIFFAVRQNYSFINKLISDETSRKFPKHRHLTTFQHYATAQKTEDFFHIAAKAWNDGKLITVFTRACNLKQLWASSIQFMPLHITYTGSFSILLSFTSLDFFKFLKIIPHAQVLSLQSHIPSLDHRSNRLTW